MNGYLPKVLNFDQLFLRLNRFICNYTFFGLINSGYHLELHIVITVAKQLELKRN
jgi:hypothetical protein